jgi:hypothetical protein
MSTTTDSTPDRRRACRAGRLAATLALMWTVLVLLAHLVVGSYACGSDTSNCGRTRHKTTVYHGYVPFPNTLFKVAFPSIVDYGGLVGGFRTDSNGHYCIVWAPESGTFIINGNQTNFGPPRGRLLLGRFPAGCQSGNRGVPWWRAEDLGSSPQYRSVTDAALLTMLVLVFGLIGGPSKLAARVRATGVVLALASTILFLAVSWPTF